MARRVIGIDAQCGLQRRDGLRDPAQPLQGVPQIQVSPQVRRRCGNGLLVLGQRGSDVTGILESIARVDQALARLGCVRAGTRGIMLSHRD